MPGRELLDAASGAFLDQGAKLLGLRLKRIKLGFEELALYCERFLRVLRLDQLVGQIERRIDVLFGEAENLRADGFGAGLGVAGGAVNRADGFLRDGDETLERLARLINAAFGKIPQLIRNLEGGASQFHLPNCAPKGAIAELGDGIAELMLQCNMILRRTTKF
jgi:hypothetical protein